MKKLLLALLVLGMLCGGLLFAGHGWLKNRFERDTLVAEIEKAWSCRVTMDSSHLNLFHFPAEVQIKELRLYPRDEQVKKSYAERTEIDPALSLVSVKAATLQMTLMDLIQKTAAIEKILLEDVNLVVNIDKKGRNKLAELFKKPRPDVVPEPAPQPKPEDQPKKEKPPLHAKDLFLAWRVKEASMVRLTAKIENQQAKKDIEIRDLHLNLRDINIDPNDLAHHNHCSFDLKADFNVHDQREDRQVGDVKLTGSGSLKPFNADTGFADPFYEFSLKVEKDSLVGGAPLMEQLNKKDREKLEKYNIDLAGLTLGGKLKEDALFQLKGHGARVAFANPLKMSFPQYDIQVLQESWWDSAADDHEIKLVLVGDAELTKTILNQAEKALEETLGGNLAAIAKATVQGTLMNEEGRLVLPLKSQKRLSKPDVRLDNALGDIQDTLKDAGRSFLRSLLQE